MPPIESIESELMRPQVLDIDLGHRRKLQREIANTKRLARDPAFVQPLYGIEPQQSLAGYPSPGNNEPQSGTPTKRGYRHHPKPDTNAPERPYSAYVMFSNHTREELKSQGLSFTNLSRQVGERWQALSTAEKEAWKLRGAGPRDKYKADVAEYSKTEKFRQHQKYLAEFKATQGGKKMERKQSVNRRSPAMHKAEAYSSGMSMSPPKPRQVDPVSGGQGESSRTLSKVAIKRLKIDEENWTGSGKARSPRARQACEPCRRRKIKCNGEQPACRQCTDNGGECHYENGKRDTKKT